MADVALSQSLSQQQTLAPQMRQSLEILQANALELSQLLSQALEANPVLEDVTEHESFDEIVENEAPDPDNVDDWQESYDDDLRELRILERRANGTDHDAAERREHFYNSIVAPESLQDHLARQLMEGGFPEEARQDALLMVSNLTDHGLLDGSLEDLAIALQIPLDRLDEGLALIQTLDPPGVGAVDLRDCLLIQLERLGMGQSLEARVVADHLEEFSRNQYPAIARALGVQVDRIVEAAEHIKTLDPSPGSRFLSGGNPYVMPDVRIIANEFGDWDVELTGSYLPRIRVNDEYKELLANSSGDRKTRNYLRNSIRDGRAIIRAVDQRQETILAIARQIVDNQQPFLEKGSQFLRPLTMNDIAEVIGVHPTTVSRAVAGKYIDTPHGLMEMRKFFATGYQTSDGGNVSNEAVREAIQDLIDHEDQANPYSDARIEKVLGEKGIKVARRTVAKYREQLGILPSHLRKKF